MFEPAKLRSFLLFVAVSLNRQVNVAFNRLSRISNVVISCFCS